MAAVKVPGVHGTLTHRSILNHARPESRGGVALLDSCSGVAAEQNSHLPVRSGTLLTFCPSMA